MSGGSYDYAYRSIEDAAWSFAASSPQHSLARKYGELLAEACKAIEWCDSGDLSGEDADKAADAFFGFASTCKADCTDESAHGLRADVDRMIALANRLLTQKRNARRVIVGNAVALYCMAYCAHALVNSAVIGDEYERVYIDACFSQIQSLLKRAVFEPTP